ncbi:MAG TPA: alpha/beta hydrolase [Pseudonocardia sp.]|jgi:acetyl esterase/lipase
MTSTESKYLADIYAEWLGRMTAEPEMQLPAMRDLFEQWHLVTGEPTDVTYEEVDADGVPSVWCVPKGCATDRVVLYTHGGGFVVGSRHTHRKLAGHLAKAIGCRALVVDYRRAPEHPFPAQLDDSVRVYRWLLAQGIEAGHIATSGDSAGGNLAISVALKLREDGDPLPAALLPMSPWLDMEHKGETLESNAATDALVQRSVLEGMSAAFLGADGSATDPLANPLYADPAGLPPIFMNVGGAESLLDNAQRFEAIAKRAGVEVRLDVADGMQHVYPFLAGRAPEGDKAVNDMADWVRPKLGLA